MAGKIVRNFGVRWQSGSGDGAFEQTKSLLDANDFRAGESSVALCMPPQSTYHATRHM